MTDNLEICFFCNKSEEDTEGGEKWTQCTDCDQWVHNSCAGIETDVSEDDSYYCAKCEKVRLEAEKSHVEDNGKKQSETKEDHQDGDENVQLQLIADLIKEKEELYLLKQKQLDLMEKVSSKHKKSTIQNWANSSASHLAKNTGLPAGTSGATTSTSQSSKSKDKKQVGGKTKESASANVVDNSKVTRSAIRSNLNRDDVFNDVSNLMKRQMQLMNQQHLIDLPEFDGDSDVWPIFFQQFKTTTEEGGFDDAFNLIRLRKALKGEARQSVIGILALPNGLPDVMAVLEKRFGSTDVIVRRKLKKLNSLVQPNENKPQTIKSFYEFILGLVATLRASDAINYLTSPQTLDSIIEKLPPNMSRQWIRYRRNLDDSPTVDDFVEWFEPFYICANEFDKEVVKPEPLKRNENRVNVHEEKLEGTNESTLAKNCKFCRKEQHTILQCKDFQRKSNRDRWWFVRKKGLCFVCLKGRHHYASCKDKQKCNVEGCEEKHNFLLHKSKPTKPSNDTSKNEKKPAEFELSAMMSSVEMNATHYRSLPVTLFNPIDGKTFQTWAFLDEGSAPTMILDSVANDLGLQGDQEEFCTTWTDNSVRTEYDSKRVKLQISGCGLMKKFNLKNVRTVSRLQLPMPTTTRSLIAKYDHLRDIEIPDAPLSRPTILIGLEHAKLGLAYEIREGKWNEPIGTNTRLGWAIHGKEDKFCSQNFSCHVCECSNDDFTNLMREFHSTESFGTKIVNQPLEAIDDIQAKKVLQKTTKNVGQEYETGLIWKRNDIQLPESKNMAVKRLHCFEQKLNRDAILKSSVQLKILEHISKKYLVKLAFDEIPTPDVRHWYLPIFAVQNVNKPGKPRLVFDAAAKVNGVSLNTMLLKGPEMIASLFGIILRFRSQKIAVSADIAEMFHRVRIIPEDQLCQLVLWRNCEDNKPIDVYKMTRMTFGATCSPCSAQYVMTENAKRFSDLYPEAVTSILQSHYVDDLLECFESEEEAIRVSQQIRAIHNEAGFNIRNWISNSIAVANQMNSNDAKSTAEVSMNLSDEATERVLGMFWTTKEDSFVFRVNMTKINGDVASKKRLPTKREMLKVIMSQFDPLGFLSPVIVHAKIMMQEVWRQGIDWDEKIPIYLMEKWFEWIDALNQVIQLRIPRCYFRESQQLKHVSLHIFGDASEEAFAAIAFIQVKGDDETYASFVAAKSRVAPQKALTIPRLELQAAVLAVRLKNTLVHEFVDKVQIQLDRIIFWTDSQTVLAWIRSTTRRYSSFVSHRISEILDSSTVCQWRWLPSEANVADEATRSVERPVVSTRWIHGPEFLRGDDELWPIEKERAESTNEEVKPVNVQYEQFLNTYLIDATRFSKYERLLRCTAFVMRYVNKLRHRISETVSKSKLTLSSCIRNMSALSSDELNIAEKIVYKMIQMDQYASEINTLRSSDQQVSTKSKIYNLNPMLDADGILRMASRIDVTPSVVCENLKRPIILSQDHRVTHLLIDAVHRKFHHQNKEYVVNYIRQQLWIPKIRVQVNKVVKNCAFCKYRSAKPKIPLMATLPQARLCPFQPAFSRAGVDFFGPIEVTIGRRHEKRWGVLFVCLTMRAIHIELSSSLNTSSAIMCVRNFSNRRGPPVELWSDNGTNFRGAEKELKQAVEEIDFNRVTEELAQPIPNEIRTTWKFIPPSAPHFGGSWERMIRTVKQSLYVILKSKYPREETLRSALIEIENLVNSRPLYYSPNDVDNKEAITPNHLLRGSNHVVMPLCGGDFDSRKQWKASQSLADEFWRRWLQEYLPSISVRSKWHADVDSIKIGQLVLVVDDSIQRGEWRRGIITKVFPSKDGRIRSAELRTASGSYVRPVSKLAIINMDVDM